MKNENEEIILKRNKLSYLIISFTQGISTLVDLAVTYFLKDEMNLQPYEMSRVFAFIMIPWVLKPILGLITDLVPLFGYRRKTYLIICGLISVLCWIYMGLWANTFTPIILSLFFISFSICFASVIGEAIIVELSKIKVSDEGNSNEAKNYVSSFFLVKNAGVLISSFFKGYLVEIMSLRNIFLLNAIIPLFIVLSGIVLIESENGLIKTKIKS